MKMFVPTILGFVLGGCANSITLMDRTTGAIYQGEAPASLTYNGDLTMTVEGEVFTGQWAVVQQGGGSFSSFGNAFGSGSAGMVSATASSFGVVNSAQGNGQAFMSGDRGGSMRCRFEWNTNSQSGQGLCERNDGRLYDMIVGG